MTGSRGHVRGCEDRGQRGLYWSAGTEGSVTQRDAAIARGRELLQVRFGVVPEALAERMCERGRRPELEGLLRRAIVVESLEELARELG